MVEGIPADDCAPRPTLAASADEAIERHLVASVPRVDSATGITINGGPIMKATREDLRARLAGLRDEAEPMAAIVPAPAAVLPPVDPLPFTVGSQLDLFELAA